MSAAFCAVAPSSTTMRDVAELSPEGVSKAQRKAYRARGYTERDYKWPKSATLTIVGIRGQPKEYNIGYLPYDIVKYRVQSIVDRTPTTVIAYVTIQSKHL